MLARLSCGVLRLNACGALPAAHSTLRTAAAVLLRVTHCAIVCAFRIFTRSLRLLRLRRAMRAHRCCLAALHAALRSSRYGRSARRTAVACFSITRGRV